MKAELDPAFVALRGSAGNFTYRKIRGSTYLSPRRQGEGTLTPGQLEHRERFHQAVSYGKTVMSNPEVRALYEAEARSRNLPVFSVTIADFFKAPTIHKVDYSLYDGKVGSILSIQATDDFAVASVHVSIQDTQGAIIESGNAVEESDQWRYTAKANVPLGTEVVLRVTATDLPGGSTVKTIAL